MREDAARVMWADDYESLRARAQAHLSADDTQLATAPARTSRNVRVISPSRGPAVEEPRRAEPPRRYASPAEAPRRPAPERVPAPRSYGSRRGPAPRRAPEPRPTEPRRTVVVTGQRPTAQRRPPALARMALEPDRAALWAVMLGIFLALVAVATAHA